MTECEFCGDDEFEGGVLNFHGVVMCMDCMEIFHKAMKNMVADMEAEKMFEEMEEILDE